MCVRLVDLFGLLWICSVIKTSIILFIDIKIAVGEMMTMMILIGLPRDKYIKINCSALVLQKLENYDIDGFFCPCSSVGSLDSLD